MRSLVACSLVLSAAAVAAPARPSKAPPKRKPVTEKYTAPVLSKYVDAIILDKDNAPDKAIHAYRQANEISEQPNTYYNIGDIYRRIEKYDDAIAAFQKYLELAPKAPDRREVEALIAAMQRAPHLALIDDYDPDAIVLVDGVVAGPSPHLTELAPGVHRVERIGPTTYQNHRIEATPGRHSHHVNGWSSGQKPETGNVVLSGSAVFEHQGSWRSKDDKITFEFPGRFTLAPGHYETDMWEPGRVCEKIVFDVPKATDLVYVYLESPGRSKPGGCLPIKIRTQRLKVAR